MLKKFLLIAVAAVALAGCVLQSREPLFDDGQAVRALGTVGGTTETASLREGKWVIDEERIPITVEQNHYAVRAKSQVLLHFVPLRGAWFVMQARESQGPAGYMLAEVKDNLAEVHPLLCKELAQDHAASHSISFVGDDCGIKADADPKKLFTSLIEKAGKPSFRLQIVH